MKKLALVLILLLLFTACGKEPVDPNTEEGKASLEASVEEALFDYHRELYDEGDTDGVGFVVMGSEAKDGKLYVYTINMYGVYNEVNDAMCKTDGHACIPMVAVLDEVSLEPIEIIEPTEGDGYFDSVMELFPEEYRERIFDLSIEDYTAISAMESEHVVEYLDENDLEMVIKQ